MRNLARIVVMALAAAVLAACGTASRQQEPTRPLKGHFDKATLVGHTTVLVFWASWCEFCEANVRRIDAIERRLPASSGLRFAGITVDSNRAAAQAFADRVNLRFDNFLDGEDEARRDKVGSLTTVLVVDAGGHVARRYTRFADGDMARLEADLQALAGS